MSACPQQLLKKDGVFYVPVCMYNNAIDVTGDDDGKKGKREVQDNASSPGCFDLE